MSLCFFAGIVLQRVFFILLAVVFILLPSFAKKDQQRSYFITEFKYAQMLYRNVDHIGCIKCHGERGKPKVISTYVKDGNLVELVSPDISNLSKRDFTLALRSKNTLGIMPKYLLTDYQIESLYFYLKKVNEDNEDSKNTKDINIK